jgi:RimJ/RimL family protein N-acetyltransferase
LELGDAKQVMGWRPSPFPISAEKAEEKLKEDVPDDAEQEEYRLVACRRSDGRAVGSALLEGSEPPSAYLRLSTDPVLGAEGARVQAEMLALLAPWLSAERHWPAIHATLDASLEPVVKSAESLGMRPAVRLRDGVWREGRHHDQVIYEYLHPWWVERFGDPGPGIDGAGEPVAAPRAPAPRRDPDVPLDVPVNTIIASERLALRVMEVDDAETIANLLRKEPNASFGHARFPYSAVVIGDWIEEDGDKEPPTDLEFALVLRETGELIGENGLYSIDWLARTAESGTWIYKPEYRGGGYGTEAKHLLLEYAFERLGLHMIWSWVKDRNPRSQAALRKQGYRDAGRMHWIEFGPEGFADARMFDLMASEWRAARDGVTG